MFLKKLQNRIHGEKHGEDNTCKRPLYPGLTIYITLDETAIIKFDYVRSVYYACGCNDIETIHKSITEMYELYTGEMNVASAISQPREVIEKKYNLQEAYHQHIYIHQGLLYNVDFGHHYDFTKEEVIKLLVEDISCYPEFLRKKCQNAQADEDLIPRLERYCALLEGEDHNPEVYNSANGKEIYNFCFHNKYLIYSADNEIRKMYFTVNDTIESIYNVYMTLHR